MNVFAGLPECARVIHEMKWRYPKTLRETFLSDIEAFRKLPVFRVLVNICSKAVHRSAEEYRGCNVQRQVKE